MYLPLLHSYILYKIIHVSLTHRLNTLEYLIYGLTVWIQRIIKKKQVFALTNRGIVYTA